MTEAAADRAMLETPHRLLLMAAVIMVTVVQILDVTIANVALPHMRSSLNASFDSVSWVLTSFIIAMVITTPIVGWLSDRIGSRRVFLWSFAGFLLASALCGSANSLEAMVGYRIFQGVCAGIMGPMTQTIILDINPRSKQPAAMNLWGMIIMIAPVMGPLLGGYLTETLNWRWVFYINLPIGIPTLFILFWLLPSRGIVDRRLDRFGVVALVVTLGALQLLLDRGHSEDWFTSTEIVIELIVVLSALWMFAVHITQTDNPIFAGAIFRSPNFLGILLFMFIVGITNVGIASVLPTMFQNIYGYSAFDTGMLSAPRGLGMATSLILCGKIMHRFDVRYLTSAGFFITGLALWQMSHWTINTSAQDIINAGVIQGIGLGMIFAPINIAALGSLPQQYRPDGAALLNLMRNIGGSFGISIIISLLAHNTQTSHADLASHVTPFDIQGMSMDIGATAARLGDLGAAGLQIIDLQISRRALMVAYQDNFYGMALFIFAISLMPLLLKPIRLDRP